MKHSILLVSLMGNAACATSTPQAVPYNGIEEVCTAWTDVLGESHQCPNAEGGALNRDLMARALVQRVVTEGYPMPGKDFGRSSLVFAYDGTYQARKLRFTGYSTVSSGQKVFLVYAEDSSGSYAINSDGTINLEEPDFSSCSARRGQGDSVISPHIQTFRKTQPYRTSRPEETGIAFETKGWLARFTGDTYWSGKIEHQRDVLLPPFPSAVDKPLRFDFEGFLADIHYGCLEGGYETFTGEEPIKVIDEVRTETAAEAMKLQRGTRWIP